MLAYERGRGAGKPAARSAVFNCDAVSGGEGKMAARGVESGA